MEFRRVSGGMWTFESRIHIMGCLALSYEVVRLQTFGFTPTGMAPVDLHKGV